MGMVSSEGRVEESRRTGFLLDSSTSRLPMVSRRSRVRTFVFVQTAIEVQALENELDRGGDGRRVPADIKFADRVSDTIEVAELVNVVERGHHLRGVDGQSVVEG